MVLWETFGLYTELNSEIPCPPGVKLGRNRSFKIRNWMKQKCLWVCGLRASPFLPFRKWKEHVIKVESHIFFTNEKLLHDMWADDFFPTKYLISESMLSCFSFLLLLPHLFHLFSFDNIMYSVLWKNSN